MSNLLLKLTLITFCVFASNMSNATDAAIGPVTLDTVGIVNVAGFGHAAGNLEVKITNGISNLNGASCDPNYLTTRNTGEGFDAMVSVLLTAQVSGQSLLLGITDNPAHTAFPGRCSLVYAVITK